MKTKIETELEYGQEVVDNVTGYTGTVVAVTQWQYGCVRIGVQGKMSQDGKIPDLAWIDEPQLTGKIAKAPGAR